MKKLITALFVCLILVVSSCTERTCPTYTKAPAHEIPVDGAKVRV